MEQMPCEVLQRLYVETLRRIETFRLRVRQGVSVEDAQDFGRYVQWSGICDLMAINRPPTAKLRDLFPYDGAQLRSVADTLVTECCEYYQGRTRNSDGTAKGASKSDLEAIDAKLAVIVARLAALESGRPPVHVVSSEQLHSGEG
jgi:hypothetical protein